MPATDRQEIRKILFNSLQQRLTWFFEDNNDISIRESFCSLCVRVWRLNWFDIPYNIQPNGSDIDQSSDPSIHNTALNILRSSNDPYHLSISMTIINQTINDFRIPLESISSFYQKRIVLTFRQKHLILIFEYCVNRIKEISNTGNPDQITLSLLKEMLELCSNSLSFIYESHSKSDSSDFIKVLEINSEWNNIIKESPIFFYTYSLNEDLSNLSLEILVFMNAFSTENNLLHDSPPFHLYQIFEKIKSILQYKNDLNSTKMCLITKLLFVLVEQYGTTLLYKMESQQKGHFLDVLDMYMEICEYLLENFNVDLVTTAYILKFWSKVGLELDSILGEDNYNVVVLVQYFIDNLINKESHNSTYLSDKNWEYTLDIIPELFIGVTKFSVGEQLSGIANNLRNRYIQLLNNSTIPSDIEIIERQLAWVVRLLDILIHKTISYEGTANEQEEEEFNAEKTSIVFSIIQLQKTHQTESLSYLEHAIMLFLKRFIVIFFGSESMVIFGHLQNQHGFESPKAIFEIILHKIVENLKIWSHNAQVVKQSLEAFNALSNTKESSNLLAESEYLNKVVENHYELSKDLKKNCLGFYKMIAQSIYFNANANYQFIKSIIEEIEYVLIENNLLMYQDTINCIIIILRGINSSCQNNKNFSDFFDWFYPYYEPLIGNYFKHCLQYNADTTFKTLKFIAEFCENKNGRLSFPNESPNDIKIFKSTANILIDLGKYIIQNQNNLNEDVLFKYRKYFCNILNNIIGGEYCNFGVFYLYNDDIIYKLFIVVYNVLFTISLDKYKQHGTLKSLFKAIEIICSFELGTLYKHNTHSSFIPSNEFIKTLLQCIEWGLEQSNNEISIICYKSIEMLLYHHFNLKNVYQMIDEECLMFFKKLKLKFFDLLLYADVNIALAISKALFYMKFLQPKVYSELQREIILSQPDNIKTELENCFNQLSQDVSNSITRENQEVFSNNFLQFYKKYVKLIDYISFYRYFFGYLVLM